MAANNTIMVVGRAGRDAEVRMLQSGRAVAKFSLAVTRPGKDPQGQETTDWFQVDLWGRQAELAGEFVKKGTLLSVAGACHIEDWTDRDGHKRTSVKISADGFQLLESRASREERGQYEAREARPMAATAAPAAKPAGDAFEGEFLEEDDIPPF